MNEQQQSIPTIGGMSGAGASAEMPRYKCHKEVWALKIAAIHTTDETASDATYAGAWNLIPSDSGYGPIRVSHEYFLKHAPKVGGYYVVYKDGYQSFSPADAFEEGYTRV